MTPDEIRIVADDLNYLKQWDSDIPEGDIRRGSAVLRRLFVDDAYGTAWRAVGESKQPHLVAVDISSIAAAEVIDQVVYAIAAGANFRGISTACMVMNKGSKPVGSLGPPLSTDGYPGEREFSLSEFLQSPSGVVEGRVFTRREVIKYISNVKGGVHLGKTEKKAEKKLVARLAKIEKKISVHYTDGLLVETLAIGQALARAKDTEHFINVAKGI